jgi:hypothetical protein
MIGTHSHRRPFLALFMIGFAAILWGCSDAPLGTSTPDTDGVSVALDAVPVPEHRKPEVTETTGVIDEVDYAGMRLRMGASWFRADDETELDLPGCGGCGFDAVEVGDWAKVKHERTPGEDGAYYAREIEIEEQEVDEEAETDDAETVGNVEAVEGLRLRVAGVWFWTDSSTRFEFDDCAADVVEAGDEVKIEHSAVEDDDWGYYVVKIEVRCREE